jgi:hypothetical protein
MWKFDEADHTCRRSRSPGEPLSEVPGGTGRTEVRRDSQTEGQCIVPAQANSSARMAAAVIMFWNGNFAIMRRSDAHDIGPAIRRRCGRTREKPDRPDRAFHL